MITMIPNPNIQILEAAAERLRTLTEEMVFVGGCATGLLLTDPATSPIRATIDVDVLVEIATLGEYHWLSEQLRQLGFVEDTSEYAPICRYKTHDVILDVMPTDPKILGFGNHWFTPAYKASEWATLPSGKQIRLLLAPYFLATKLEAFDCRGKNDYLMSRDMEDIVTVLDGRSEIVSEVQQADTKLKHHLAVRFSMLLKERDFLDALPGYLPPDTASQARSTLIIDRLKAIAESRSIKGEAISP
jgi:predicted nucleotidyltransferase